MTAWVELADEVGVRREIIRTVADIKLLPARYKGDRPPVGRQRPYWTWSSEPSPR